MERGEGERREMRKGEGGTEGVRGGREGIIVA